MSFFYILHIVVVAAVLAVAPSVVAAVAPAVAPAVVAVVPFDCFDSVFYSYFFAVLIFVVDSFVIYPSFLGFVFGGR